MGEIRVKRRGKVRILRFSKRKPYRPERKPSAKRFLRRIRAIIPCTNPEITVDELEDLILKTFGSNYSYHILLSDEKYRIITKQEMIKLLKSDNTDTLNYKSIYADCDDFSDVLLGSLTRKTWVQGFAIGQLWYINVEKRFAHAVNLFCDGSKIWIIEPQNDAIIEWGTGVYSGKAFMVKF